MNISPPSARMKRFGRWQLFSAILISLWTPLPAAAQSTITVDPSTRFQTITGWECVAFASQEDPSFSLFKDELLDRVIREAGITRIRLEVRAGAENATDYFGQFQSGQIDYDTWRANRYATVNDNADPNATDEAGFHFTELDQNIRDMILPLRDLAASTGEPLFINLNYVAFTSQITQGGGYHHADAAEYAEFILAVFQHMDREFGFVPDAVEILLEPDNVPQWSGTTVGNAIVAVVDRLSAAGYSPAILAPSCTNMGNAITYFDALAAVPGALPALDEICYHRYGGVSEANLQTIASRARQHGKQTSMLEWWSTGNGIDVLLNDLTTGHNSAWQQGVLAGMGDPDANMPLYKVDATDPSAPVIQVNRKTRLLRQVYRFVRPGAVRVAATSSSGSLAPVAFINQDRGFVVVVRVTAAGSFSIHGLPAGTYGINYSSATEFNSSLSGQTLASGEPLTTSMPANGALTVYSLRSDVSAAMLDADTFQLAIRNLKPGFTGFIERSTALANPGSWHEIATTDPADFLSTWTEPVGVTPAFFRFRSE